MLKHMKWAGLQAAKADAEAFAAESQETMHAM